MDLKSRVTENILGIFNNRCEMAKKKKKKSVNLTHQFMKY